MNLTFGELRKYISAIDRVSICTREDLCYENFRFIKDVPDKYDTLYVYGIGRIESEFKIDEHTMPSEAEGHEIVHDMFLAQCIEIMVSKVPRDEYKEPISFFDGAYTETRYH